MAKKSEPSIKPLGDRVLVQELGNDDKEKKTASGIILPDSHKEDKGARKAKVVAVGEGRYEEGKLIPVRVKAGDIVLFNWGDDLTVDGVEYHIVNESNILAVLS